MAQNERVTPAPSLLKRLALNTLTWWLLASVALVAHGVLALLLNDASWMQRGGGLVIVGGLMAIARPLIRIGERILVESNLPLFATFMVPNGFDESNRDRLRPEAMLDSRAVQRDGPLLVLLGTLMSAYGDLLFKAFR